LHRKSVRKRGIAFTLSFEEWQRVWRESGHWDDRGRPGAEGYGMTRINNAGGYAAGNVCICSRSESSRARWAVNTE